MLEHVNKTFKDTYDTLTPANTTEHRIMMKHNFYL